MDPSLESYILLLLADSNLPTGGFIASSGLESHIQHGFLFCADDADGRSPKEAKAAGVLQFVARSLHAYAHLNLPFLSVAHARLVSSFARPSIVAAAVASEGVLDPVTVEEDDEDALVEEMERLDRVLETMCLNHAVRRASVAQGIALLTLYERSFSPALASTFDDGIVERDKKGVGDAIAIVAREERARRVVLRLKSRIRSGTMKGHLTIGFAVLTSSLGLSLEASQHLFLFLHARSILSSAVRLNTIGPYLSHRLLFHDVQPLVQQTLLNCRALRIGDDEGGLVENEEEEGEMACGTWPLLEILSARHDTLHSKIFNS